MDGIRVVPIQLPRLFGQSDPVCTVAERQVGREAASADIFRFAADRYRIPTRRHHGTGSSEAGNAGVRMLRRGQERVRLFAS